MHTRILGLVATFALTAFAGRARLVTADDRSDGPSDPVDASFELALPDVLSQLTDGARGSDAAAWTDRIHRP